MENTQETIKFILLPGLNGTDGLFQTFMNQAPSNFQLMALSYPTDKELTYEELTVWVCEKISDVSGRLVLLGESFSGPLSLFVANKSTKNIVAVILVASFINPPRSSLLKALPWCLGFSITKQLYALCNLLSGNSKTVFVIKSISNELQKVNSRVLAHRVRQTLSVNATNALAACKVPILYMQASKDIIVPKSALRNIMSVRDSINLAVFPTQHFLLQSLPNESWLAISDFVNGLSANKSLKDTA